jgi:hypothetical protein
MRLRFLLDRKLTELQDWSERFSEEKSLLSLAGIDPRFPGRAAHSPVILPPELSRLLDNKDDYRKYIGKYT